MLVRRPDRPQTPYQISPTVIPSTRNPGSFAGWGPKL